MNVILENQTEFQTSDKLLEKLNQIASKLTDKEIELILTSNEEIRKINKEFRNKDKETDVISFPLQNIPHSPLGSVIISVEKAKEEAQKLGHKIEDEITLLFIHGLLHLLGYDHEKDDGEMREMEKSLIEEFELPKSLIIRSES
ncbi:MAG: rRNA maturation RNase YbeY [Epsilonproteobacteria bacterium]|nr:rRNA maturation RNase YbeY [Campylobacterota bacterium]